MKENFPHNFHGVDIPDKVIESKIGTIYFYNTIVIVEINEGISLSYQNGFSLLLKGIQYLSNKPFVYISNRIHSYSVNPTDYRYLNSIPTLKGLVIVKNNPDSPQNEKLEERFAKKPFIVVNTIEEGIARARKILGKN